MPATITDLREVLATRYVTPLREGGSLPGLVEIDPRLAAAEPDPEIQDLIAASGGLNLGVDFLPGALPYTPAGAWQPDPELAAEVVWLDALTTNVDRCPRNPNLLLWHDRLWLIDHGAALYLQHGGLEPEQHAARPFPTIADHVLLPRAGSILEAGRRMRERLNEGLLEAVVALVPAPWLGGGDDRATYAEYLRRRLQDGGFASEAERARAA